VCNVQRKVGGEETVKVLREKSTKEGAKEKINEK